MNLSKTIKSFAQAFLKARRVEGRSPLYPKLWDVKTARATGKSAEAQKINAAVDRIRVDVNRRYQELMQSDGYVTAARLRIPSLHWPQTSPLYASGKSGRTLS